MELITIVTNSAVVHGTLVWTPLDEASNLKPSNTSRDVLWA